MSEQPFLPERLKMPAGSSVINAEPNGQSTQAVSALSRIAARAAATRPTGHTPPTHTQERSMSRSPASKRSDIPLLRQIWKPSHPSQVSRDVAPECFSWLPSLWKSLKLPANPPSSLADESHPSFPVYRNVTYDSGIPIASLDASPTKSHAVLAGRDILSIVQLTEELGSTTCNPTTDLRADIIAHRANNRKSPGHGKTRHGGFVGARDVKWSHGNFDRKVITAAADGQIFVYDVDRPGLEDARLHEHHRQVHRLAVNPFGGYLVLSGSQDATIRMWDLRDYADGRKSNGMSSRKKFSGNSDAVRDLRWSPSSAVEFAVATDSGRIQLWDIRKDNAPLLRISAHEKACQTVDWHPDGKHVASAGIDKDVKVWDFSSSDRRQKPIWQLRAPQAVLQARWRPPTPESGSGGSGEWQSTHLATSFDKEDPRILVWDFRRPYKPAYIHNEYDEATTSFLWSSEQHLWSVGSHGKFLQRDLRSLQNGHDEVKGTPFAFTPDSSIIMLSQPAMQEDDVQQALQQDDESAETRQVDTISGPSSLESGSKGASIPVSVPSKDHRAKRVEPPGSHDSRGASPLPAYTSGAIVSLDKSLRPDRIYKPQQSLHLVQIPGLFNKESFIRRARGYKSFRIPNPPQHIGPSTLSELHMIFNQTCRHNATIARSVNETRMAQEWEIIAQQGCKELRDRAETRRKQRVSTAKDATTITESQAESPFILSDFEKSAGPDTGSLPHFATLTAMLPELVIFHAWELYDLVLPVWSFLYLTPYFNFDSSPLGNRHRQCDLIRNYHDRLLSFKQTDLAARLRKDAGQSHSEFVHSVMPTGDRGDNLLCSRCDSVRDGPIPLQCSRCGDLTRCPVCLLVGLPLRLWCRECRHGGHPACMEAFWATDMDQDGGCAEPYCACQCKRAEMVHTE